MITDILQYTLAGLSQGGIYAVVAIGFVLIYKTTGIINFAQGEFVMLGGMLSVWFYQFLPLAAAICTAIVSVALIGGLLEYLFFRRLKNLPVIKMVLITIGISILLRKSALLIWGEQTWSLPYFTGSGQSAVSIFGAYISPQKIWLLTVALITIIILIVFFKKTRTGLAMRACADHSEAARLCGINSSRLLTLSFVLSAALAAMAGAVLSPLSIITYDCGAEISIKAFAAAALGGLHSLAGAVAGALLLGLLEAFSIIWLPESYKDIISLVILILILLCRPRGLFSRKELQSLKEF